MTIKQFIKNIRLSNLIYIIQAKYRKFIASQYESIYSSNKIDDMLYATYKCPKCFENNSAECCGCNFKEMILSDKKCKYNKW